jgi:hypothetical protein
LPARTSASSAFAPMTATEASPFRSGSVAFSFLRRTIDLRAASSASCRCFGESTTASRV